MLLVTIVLLGVTGYTIYQAPNLTSLEQRLWTWSLYQARDNLNITKDVVAASIKQQKLAKENKKRPQFLKASLLLAIASH